MMQRVPNPSTDMITPSRLLTLLEWIQYYRAVRGVADGEFLSERNYVDVVDIFKLMKWSYIRNNVVFHEDTLIPHYFKEIVDDVLNLVPPRTPSPWEYMGDFCTAPEAIDFAGGCSKCTPSHTDDRSDAPSPFLFRIKNCFISFILYKINIDKIPTYDIIILKKTSPEPSE